MARSKIAHFIRDPRGRSCAAGISGLCVGIVGSYLLDPITGVTLGVAVAQLVRDALSTTSESGPDAGVNTPSEQ